MATKNRRAGALRERLAFQAKGFVDDGWGGHTPTGEWETRFEVAGSLQPRNGGEAIVAARLQGEQPYILTIRQSTQTAAITTAWRVVDTRAGSNAEGKPHRVFAIKAPPTDPDGKNAWLEILVTENAAS